MKPARRWRWPATVVLVCFGALVLEIVVYRITPISTIAPAIRLAEKATCAVCALTGLFGLFQRPKAIAVVVCVLGVIVGIFTFLLILAAESFSSIFV